MSEDGSMQQYNSRHACGPRRISHRLWVFSVSLFLLISNASGDILHVPYPAPKFPVADVFFLDSLQGWISAVGANGCFLLRTRDGGNSWTTVENPHCIYKVFFLNADIGWGVRIAAHDADETVTALMQTRDGGDRWDVTSAMVSPKIGPKILIDFLFTDHHNGLLVGQEDGEGFLLHTPDGGKTFVEPAGVAGTVDVLHDITTLGDGNIWVFGHDAILRSTDYGLTWERQLEPENLPSGRLGMALTSGWVRDDGRGWAVGSSAGAVILSTEDYGRQWSIAVESDEANSFEAVHFWDGEHGCAVGASRLLTCTPDGGQTWTARKVLPKAEEKEGTRVIENRFVRVVFLPSGRGWVVTVGGYLYQTDDAGDSWKEIDLAELTGVGHRASPSSSKH